MTKPNELPLACQVCLTCGYIPTCNSKTIILSVSGSQEISWFNCQNVLVVHVKILNEYVPSVINFQSNPINICFVRKPQIWNILLFIHVFLIIFKNDIWKFIFICRSVDIFYSLILDIQVLIYFINNIFKIYILLPCY